MPKPAKENNQEPQEPMNSEELAKHITEGNNVDGSNHVEPHEGSGLFNALQDFDELVADPDEETDDKKGDEEDELSIDDIEGSDDLEDEDREKLEEFLKSEEKNLDDLDFLSDEQREFLEEKFGEKEIEEPEDESEGDLDGNLEDKEPKELIEEIKKNQRFVSERDRKIEELESTVNELKKNGNTEGDSESKAFLDGLKNDFRGTYEKYKSKLGLPDIDLVQAQFKNEGTTARVKQWQKSSLRKELEKEFNLAEGEFEYDSKEAAEAGTPSFEWDKRTDDKVLELRSQQQRLKEAEQARLDKVKEEQQSDIKWFAKRYLDNDTEKANSIVKDINQIMSDVAQGKAPSHKHPFSMRNFLIAYQHPEIVKNKVKEAVEKTKQAFAERGITLPDDKVPTNHSKKKGKGFQEQNTEVDEFSPMKQSLNNTLIQ